MGKLRVNIVSKLSTYRKSRVIKGLSKIFGKRRRLGREPAGKLKKTLGSPFAMT
jgi:hypothetical protein